MIITKDSEIFQKLLKDVEYIKQALTFARAYHEGCNPIEPPPKLEVGKWYVYSLYIFRVINIDSDWIYFDKENSHVIGEPKVRVSSGWADSCHLATASEIESHLIKVAEKKGFKEGIKYYDVEKGEICKVCENNFYYCDDDDGLTDGWGGWIYYKGKWATIITEKKPLPKTKDEFYKMIKTYFDCNDGLPFPTPIEEFLDEYED